MKAKILSVLGTFLSVFFVANLFAAENLPNALQAVNYSILPENKTQLELVMADAVQQEPRSFALDNPPRIVLDFPKTASAIGTQRQVVGLGAVNDVLVMEAGGRTRAIISLNYASSYDLSIKGKHIYVVLTEGSQEGSPVKKPTLLKASAPVNSPIQKKSNVKTLNSSNKSTEKSTAKRSVTDFDFRKGDGDDGRVIVTLSDPHTPADVHKEGERLIIDFIGTTVPPRLDRRFDVIDFSTKVQSVDIFQNGKNARLVVTTKGSYEHAVFQAGNQLSVDIKSTEGKSKTKYQGKTISLNVQDIQVRTVLQIISDEMERNVIISDNVRGSVALRLDNVPVDQALDVILKTQGLSVQIIGEVVFIGPSADIVAREKDALQAELDISELSPIKTELLQINYAKAAEISEIIAAKESSLLSDRGAVTVDKRTNSILINDTEKRIETIRTLMQKLDVPVRQVLIESRIVIANQNFGRELGVRFGVSGTGEPSARTPLSQGIASAVSGSSSSASNLVSTGVAGPLSDRLNVDLPSTVAGGRIALAIIGSDYLIDLELSAMQTEGNGEVVSTPRVVTIDQQQAKIRQGVEIGFQQASSSGATAVTFKEAVLKLDVTPQITPDDSLILDLIVSKDNVGDIIAGTPSINTRQVETRVLVKNGETVVLGGIFEESNIESVRKIPLLGDIPGVGWLFRNKSKRTTKDELLIFVTPKILKESLGAGFK